MAKANQQKQATLEELLRDLMIVQLVLAGVGQRQIREIVGVDIHRVSRIAKLIKKTKE
jgi:transposase-like protein